MKRYMLFSGNDYYPSGGMNDFIDSFDELDDANNKGVILIKQEYDWYHIFDLATMSKVAHERVKY